MTPFHIKLYYLLTEKNTSMGQSSHFNYHHGNRQHHGNQHHHGYGGMHHHGMKQKQKMMMGHQGAMGSHGQGMYVQSID